LNLGSIALREAQILFKRSHFAKPAQQDNPASPIFIDVCG
jgi:hypothetical protein